MAVFKKISMFMKMASILHISGSPGIEIRDRGILFTFSCEPRAYSTSVWLKSIEVYNFTTCLLVFLNFKDQLRNFLDYLKRTFPTQLEFLGQSPGFNIYP